MSRALYRKYRSKSLDEVIGQNHITSVLSRALAGGNVSHAYLFTGPRGVGKTSIARIMAYAINKLDYDEKNPSLDIIEIDAASNNGVDDVRDLREKVQIAPVAAEKKVYIIDEVHMLSKPAFNALLKTLEEPPEHVVFILATTNIEKVPATIVSRTQRFSFRPIKLDEVVKHLKNIAKAEKIKIADDALELIARHGEGSFRDSISLLDQVSNLADQLISAEMVADILGLAPQDIVDSLIKNVEEKDYKSIITTLEDAFQRGINASAITKQLSSEICQKIIDKPQLLPLLDALIDVDKSPKPQIKLISVLGLAAANSQAQTQNAAPVPETKNDKKPSTPKTAALTATKPEIKASIAEIKEEIKAEKKAAKTSGKPIDLDWSKLVEYAHQNSVALYSVLSKCGHEVDGNDLTIYTQNPFYKKKLDTVKYALQLNEYLQAIGVGEVNIHTIPTAVPPKDDKMAAIAAMMGGGEEVVLES